ncbi:MAG: class I SAM-dependent methyltransferase [Fuerstiella sp.]|nr:class I SAM-dependent methyltransferase [Fuerstiella sp.]
MQSTDVTAGPGNEWWKSFHLPEMADLFLDARLPEVLRDTTGFLMRELRLPPAAHVYDQCCGSGSLSIALTKQGLKLTGADLCKEYVDRANAATVVEGDEFTDGSKPEFFCADAFEFVPSMPCDGVFNWYSSFGYSSDDQRNQSMLMRAFESLKPGGWLALDIPNLPFLLRSFQTEMKHEGVSQGRNVSVVRQSRIDIDEGLLRQTWTWQIENEAPIIRYSALRLYLPHQIKRMLEGCGFQAITMFGDLASTAIELDSPRLIITAQRPE